MRRVTVALKDKTCVMATYFSQHENTDKRPQVLLEKPLPGIVMIVMIYHESHEVEELKCLMFELVWRNSVNEVNMSYLSCH